MKYLLFLAGVFAMGTNIAQQTGEIVSVNPGDEGLLEEFNSQVQQWMWAYNSGDAKNLIPLYDVHARYVSSHVEGLEANGRDALIANFQKGISGGGHLDEISIISYEVSNDLATLYCYYQATNSGVTVSGRNLIVVRKIDGKWLIVLHMTVV